MIEVERLVTGYGRIGVLNGVSLAVAPSECVGILGHNGMGKSTLLKAIVGLLPTWSGRIVLDGKPIERLAANRARVPASATCRRGARSFPGCTVRENLHFAALAKGRGRSSGPMPRCSRTSPN